MVSALLKAPYAHLVSYGAMSLQPLSLPTGAFIFRNLTAHGYNMTRWYERQQEQGNVKAREEMVSILSEMYEEGRLKEPEAEIVEVGRDVSAEERKERVRDAVRKSMAGKGGKKFVLKWS